MWDCVHNVSLNACTPLLLTTRARGAALAICCVLQLSSGFCFCADPASEFNSTWQDCVRTAVTLNDVVMFAELDYQS